MYGLMAVLGWFLMLVLYAVLGWFSGIFRGCFAPVLGRLCCCFSCSLKGARCRVFRGAFVRLCGGVLAAVCGCSATVLWGCFGLICVSI